MKLTKIITNRSIFIICHVFNINGTISNHGHGSIALVILDSHEMITDSFSEEALVTKAFVTAYATRFKRLVFRFRKAYV